MSTYSWEKFHFAAEMIRNVTDIRDALANAYAMELAYIQAADIPDELSDRVIALLSRLQFPSEIETLTGMDRAHTIVNALNENEVAEIIEEIYELETALHW